MNPMALGLVLLAVLTALATGVLGLAEPLGENYPTTALAKALAPLPPLYLLLAMVALVGSYRASGRTPPAQKLLVRLAAVDPPTPSSSAGWAAVCAAWLSGLAMAFTASLSGASWSEAWSCESTGPGETSCNLVTGPWSTLYFVVGLFVVMGFGAGLVVSLFALRKDLRSLKHLGEPIVELSSGQLYPGVPFFFRVVQPTRSADTSVTVTLSCIESATHGSGDDETTDHHTVFQQVLAKSEGAGPFVELEASATIPAGTMHTFHGSSNKVVWKLEVSSRCEGSSRNHSVEVPVSPSTPSAWRSL